MEGEYFYGAVLDKAGASITWNSNENSQDINGPLYKLMVKQILLGHAAKEGEYNVVEVKTMSETNAGVTIPIAVLKVGETRSIMTNLEFPETTVHFKLIEGNGPVYIHGNQMLFYADNGEEAEEEQVEVIEEEQEKEVEPVSKKRKITAENGSKPTNGSANNQKTNKKPVK